MPGDVDAKVTLDAQIEQSAASVQPPAGSAPYAQPDHLAEMEAVRIRDARYSPQGAMISAIPAANSLFDRFAYDDALQTHRLQVAGYLDPWEQPAPAPLIDSRVQPSPSAPNAKQAPPVIDPRVEQPQADPFAAGKFGPVYGTRNTNGYGNRVDEVLDNYDQIFPPSPPDPMPAAEGAPGLWDRLRTYLPGDSDTPWNERVDSFADVAARYGVDTGALGQKVRGIGSKALANMSEDWADESGYGKLNYAMAAAQLGQEGGRYYEATNSGKYLTPEEQTTASAGMLPGVMGMAGVAIGSMIAPGAGSWVGGLVGTGLGAGAQGIIGATEERAQSVRETTDVYGTQTGATSDALKEFTEALRTTSAATKEVQAAFTTMAAAGPGMGAGTLAGTEFLSGALGERYNPALSGLTHALSSDPLMRGVLPALNASGGNLPTAQLGNIAVAEAFAGNWDASNDAATLAEGSLTDPRYSADMNRHKDLFSVGGAIRMFNPIGALTHPVQNTQDMMAQARLWMGLDPQYLDGADEARAGITRERTEAYSAYTSAASAQEVAKTGVGQAGARMEIAQDIGGSAAQMSSLAGQLAASARSSEPALNAAADKASAFIQAHPDLDPATRLKLQTGADASRTQALQDEAAADKATRSAYEGTLQETTSAFDLSVMQATLSGQSALSQRGLVNTQAAFLAGVVADPTSPLGPAEKSKIAAQRLQLFAQNDEQQVGNLESDFGLEDRTAELSGATARQRQGGFTKLAGSLSALADDSHLSYDERQKLRREALELPYQAQLNVFHEDEQRQAVQLTTDRAGVDRGEVLGTPMDAYRARLTVNQDEKNQVGLIDARLTQKIPESERLDLLNRKAGLEGDIATGPEKARVAAYDAQGGILGDEQAAERAQLPRNIAIEGSAAYTPEMLQKDRGLIALYQGAEDGSPVGSVQRARFDKQRAQGEAQLAADITGQQTWRETSVQRTEDAALGEAEFRAGRLGGTGAMEAAGRTAAQDAGYLADLRAKDVTDPLAREANARTEQDIQNRIAVETTRSQTFSFTPEERTRDTVLEHSYERSLKAPWMEGPDSNPLTTGNALRGNLQSRLTEAQGALSKATDPLAREQDTQLVEGLKDRIADFDHTRMYEGLLPQEIEKRIGSPGGGIGIAIAPLAAATAAGSGPYSPVFGGFGQHTNPLMTTVGGMAREGGAFGDWWRTAGGNAGPTSGTPGGAAHSAPASSTPSVSATPKSDDKKSEDYLAQIASSLRQLVQNTRGSGQQPPLPQSGVHAFIQNLQAGF